VQTLGNGGLGGTDIGADWTPRAQSRHSDLGKLLGAMIADQRNQSCMLCPLSSGPCLPEGFYQDRPEEGRTDSLPLQLGLVLDAISATVPATNNVSGVYWWWRENDGEAMEIG
jgi:hypothetical protein